MAPGQNESMTAQLSISHINLPVNDIEKSIDFYVNKLGFSYIRHLRPGKVILEVSGFDFFLEESEQNVSHPRFHIGIKTTTEGVHALAKLIEEKGIAQVVGPQPTGLAEIYVTPDNLRTVFYFADPDGHIIEVYSHIGVDVGYVAPGYGKTP
jgi:catechol 2,3-dioxygenase-like lactoylglutathione lyase family enzyme